MNKREEYHKKCKERLKHYEEYIFIKDFELYKNKLRLKHSKCNYEYDVLPTNFIKGYKCPKCAGRVVDNEVVQEKLNVLHGEDIYILKSEYENSKKKLSIYHSLCENEFKSTYSNLQQGYGCPHCAPNKKKNLKEVKDYIEKFDYELISNSYSNSRTKMDILHEECGREFKMNWESFYSSGHRCPYCSDINNSKGTKEISEYLDNMKIPYEKEKKFDNLLSIKGNYLRVDFFLEEYNLCIEFDGEQHFIPFRYENGKEKFETLKENDQIKDNYFENHEKIDLIRVNYKDQKEGKLKEKIENCLGKSSTTIP
ncbi:hypothetical protein CPT_MarsHill_160 [Staphylococcus phage MarsHill]|nr:hypothetical protein CPT_MarsHill_160 [Staphylococcus phage MarsHill]